MNTRPAFLSIIGLCLFGLLARAEQEIGFIEKFALAPVRNDVLGQLVPGTEEYYFYHALHYQNTAQKPKLAAILDQWAKRFPDSSQRRILENREALMGYDADPRRPYNSCGIALGRSLITSRIFRTENPIVPPGSIQIASLVKSSFAAAWPMTISPNWNQTTSTGWCAMAFSYGRRNAVWCCRSCVGRTCRGWSNGLLRT